MEDNKKIKLGQFFTKEKVWLKEHIKQFIINSGCDIAYDPFAGAGNLLNISNEYHITKVKGLDIDRKLKWQINDSLEKIPSIKNAIIITNPPYLAKQSATRKKINLSKYFEKSSYDNLYLIALDKMLDAQKYVVAIVPESFINSSFKRKKLLSSITILEENPFDDTDTPVCVACFDSISKKEDEIKIYKNNNFKNNLHEINKIRIFPKKDIEINFNNLDGWLGIRAVDSTNDLDKIRFDFKQNVDYDWKKNIKISSRHYTLVDVKVKHELRQLFVNECNKILSDIRKRSSDTILTPFMGNTKKGVRRRRLDFKLARAIIETAYKNIFSKNKDKAEFLRK